MGILHGYSPYFLPWIMQVRWLIWTIDVRVCDVVTGFWGWLFWRVTYQVRMAEKMMCAGCMILLEPAHDKIYKMACTPSNDSGQPGHPPSLIRVFAVRMMNDRVLSYPLSAQPRLWSDWADAQADLCLRLAHMPFCRFCRALVWWVGWHSMMSVVRKPPFYILLVSQYSDHKDW